MRITHTTVANDPQSPLLGAAEWNADHTIEGTGSSQVTLSFGSTEQNLATVTVAAEWVTPTSILVASVAYEATDDHTADEALAEGITASCGNIVDGVSFDLTAFAPNCTWGEYKFNVIGV